jgi:AcrR family transcriptional regulator
MAQTKVVENNEKRQQILLAAERLFSKRNYGKTQISEIAKEASVGIGTFYRYFPDKEAVLLELLESLLVRIRRELVQIRIGIERLSPLEHVALIRRTFEVVFKEILSKPQIALTFLRSGYGASEKISELVWGGWNRMVKDFITDIARVEAVGLISVPDKETMGHCIAGMISQLSHKIIIEGKPSEEQAVDMCTRLTMGMLSSFVPDDMYEKLSPIYRMLLPPINEKSPSPKSNIMEVNYREMAKIGSQRE